MHVAYIYVKKIIIHRAKAAVDDTYAMVVTTINNYVSVVLRTVIERQETQALFPIFC